MAIEYTKPFPFQGQYRRLQDPPKFTQIGIFGLKIYHLATLLRSQFRGTTVGLASFSKKKIYQFLKKCFRLSQAVAI
jgi:hypothetical protein